MKNKRRSKGHVLPMVASTARREDESFVGMAARSLPARRCLACKGSGRMWDWTFLIPFRVDCLLCEGTGERAEIFYTFPKWRPIPDAVSSEGEKASGAGNAKLTDAP